MMIKMRANRLRWLQPKLIPEVLEPLISVILKTLNRVFFYALATILIIIRKIIKILLWKRSVLSFNLQKSAFKKYCDHRSSNRNNLINAFWRSWKIIRNKKVKKELSYCSYCYCMYIELWTSIMHSLANYAVPIANLLFHTISKFGNFSMSKMH